jgi:hypothetical protein
MFEYHGWFAIEQASDEDYTNGLNSTVEELSEMITKMTWPSGFAEIRSQNGTHFLYISGNPNRPRNWHEQIGEILKLMANKTKGSYGLLYWRDDESDLAPGKNNFHVVVLSRGIVHEHFDPFLSPTIPTIELPSY